MPFLIDKWAKVVLDCGLDKISADYREALRSAFFAGAESVYGGFIGTVEAGKRGEDQALFKFMDQLHGELEHNKNYLREYEPQRSDPTQGKVQ